MSYNYLSKEEKVHKVKRGFESVFGIFSKHSARAEFYLALTISILLISSLILESYFKVPSSITIILILIFMILKIQNLVIKKENPALEDLLSVGVLLIFLIIRLFVEKTPNAITVAGVSLVLLYSIGMMPKIDNLIESRSISSFIVSYLVFVLIIVFLFSSFYSANNSSFMEQGKQTSISFQDSFYFSAVTFTTVGYGDIIPLKENRTIAMIEALTGTILNIGFIGYVLASKKSY